MKIIVQEINQSEHFNIYVTSLSSKFLKDKGVVLRRGESKNGVQRYLEQGRVNDIQKFSETSDFIFPTPIILSISSDKFSVINCHDTEDSNQNFESWELDENDTDFIFKIIDGQHRVMGLWQAYDSSNGQINPYLPVVFIVDASLYDEAYIFSTINSNQKSVSKSLIFDLFDNAISDNGFVLNSVEGSVHYIIKQLNMNSESFKDRVKMLGIKTTDQQWISQGTIGTQLVKLISNNPTKDNQLIKNNQHIENNNNYCLRELWINHDRETMFAIIRNYFDAFSELYPFLWNKDKEGQVPNTRKTLGFMILINVFKSIYDELHPDFRKDRIKNFFKENLSEDILNEVFYTTGSGEGLAKKLADQLITGIRK